MRNKFFLCIFTLMIILTKNIFADESPQVSEQVTESINRHNVLLADQIYLADGKILKGKVIMVGKERVEYMPDGKVKSNYIPRSEIKKIVNENREEVVLNPALNINDIKDVSINLDYDMIYLKNNTIKYGKVLRVGDIHIEYDPEGEHPFDVCVRKDVEKIIYKNRKVVYFDKTYSGSRIEENKDDELDEKPSSWYIGLGIYSGFIDVKGADDIYPDVPSSMDGAMMKGGFSFYIGYVWSEKLHLGFDCTAFNWESMATYGFEFPDEDKNNPELNEDRSWSLITSSFLGSVKMFPWGNNGWFWKLSAGLTNIKIDLIEDGKSIDSKEADGLAFRVGGGYDWKVSGSFHIGVNVECFYNNYLNDQVFSNAQGMLAYMTLYWK